ncbi:hypothetical protein CORT_0A08560 [Candida orthopsilosis Co 90-125]|uniref:Uncharacterized protein n=1 Tax=Candida orthopsilosis (strain 90-125) TaxID=1136231 RepID=H8WYC5_CANO9|nr:hypothetical protein CORT_0A08560 [Candida orthopsilosis Co 90-125]CCG21240.1 hypothetical protein CORT_0A08560 [Candida orthopsilosis Co 90-125]
MKEKLRDLREKFFKLFQKEKQKGTLTLDRNMFDKLYKPSTDDNSLSESLKCRLLPSSNFESDGILRCSSPMSSDFHTSPENRAFFEPHTDDDSRQQQNSKNYTMDQLCSIIDQEIGDMKNPDLKDLPRPHSFLSNSSLATITEIQNVKFDHDWDTLYKVNQYPSDSKQWSFYKKRAETADAKPPRLVKVIKNKNRY